MVLDKLKSFKLTKTSAAVLAGIIAAAGIGVMALANAPAAAMANAGSAQPENDLSLPGAGMGDILEKYVGATSGSSIEFLSTTAVASSLEGSYNEYYDENGSTLGKLIVYNGESAADVYDKIVGNERIERGEVPAQVIGHMYAGDVATLVREQGDWFQIISDSVNGYVRREGFARGVEAEKLAGATYVNAVYTNTENVFLYEDFNTDSRALCVLPMGVRYTLMDTGEEMSRIYVPGIGEGWVLNEEIAVQNERRYAADITNELTAQNAVAEGAALASEIEEVREMSAAANSSAPGAASILQSINIAPTAPDSADVASLRQAVADYAQQFVGILPYVWGSSDLTYGADCSGFTSAIYRAYGYDIARTTDGQFYGGQQVSLDDLRPGDIICYSGHVALYVGNGTIVHESVPGTTVSYADMWMMPVIGAVRYIN